MWEIYRPTIVTVPLHCSHSALLWLPFTAADAARLRWSFALLRLGKLKASRVITGCQAPCDAPLCPARQLSELQIFECAQSTEIRHKPFFIKYPEGSLISWGAAQYWTVGWADGITMTSIRQLHCSHHHCLSFISTNQPDRNIWYQHNTISRQVRPS